MTIEVLTWNCAFGVMAGYLWPEMHGVKEDWIAAVNAFQPAVLSRLAGRALTGYRELAPEVTESDFGNMTTVANWNADRPYESGSSVIAPSGCLVTAGKGNLLAGVFVQRFNGEPLSEGPHYLVLEHKNQAWEIRQPVGEDTNLAFQIAPGWSGPVNAVGRDGRLVPAQFELQNGRLTFRYSRSLQGLAVDHYELGTARIRFM